VRCSTLTTIWELSDFMTPRKPCSKH